MRRFSDDPNENRRIRQQVEGAADTSVKLKGLATASFPAAADHRHGIIFDETTGKPKISDGSDWLPWLGLGDAQTWTGVQTFSAIPVLSGGGITFPATQVPSAGANTLDDYEEGAFTPSLLFGGANTGMTYGLQVGRYTKVGRSVHADIFISLTALGSSTGTATISGLPFSALGTAPPSPGIIVPSGLLTVTCPMCRVFNGTVINLYDFTGSTTAVLTHADFQVGSDMQIQINYQTT